MSHPAPHLTESKMTEKMTLDTWINSPRQITGGRGAWEGSLGDAIDAAGLETCAVVVDEMIAQGRVPAPQRDLDCEFCEVDDEDDDYCPECMLPPRLEEVVGAMVWDDVASLLDDPNVEIMGGGPVTAATVETVQALHGAVLEAQEAVDAARAARDATIREAIASGATMYRIAKTIGLSPQAVAQIRDAG